MKLNILLLCIWGLFFGITHANSQSIQPALSAPTVHHSDILPSMATWSMKKDLIDLAAKYTPFTVLTSLRGAGNNLDHAEDSVHNQFKVMQDYAAKQGIHLVADLDVRMALNSFEAKYPNDLQQMLALHEVDLTKPNSGVVIRCRNLNDHYKNPYIIRSGAFVRAYSYTLTSDGFIDPATLTDISNNCTVVNATKEFVQIKLPNGAKKWSRVMVMASFTILYPDLFSKSVIDFQRELIRKYADIPLAGVLKDEWGFPPSLSEETILSDFWYSKNRIAAYADRTGGRDLIYDILLMVKGIKGKENERLLAINHFNEMAWKRNGEIEDDFYRSVKETFGADAIVAVHPTWYPYPEGREFKKNGLDWWIATRDLAQTDEVTPYAARTSLAKKWGGKVWYNMDHTMGLPPQTVINADLFVKSLWSSALAGGRINNLPIDVRPEGIVGSDYIRAETRIHLLNYINPTPLDCPVAVIFGHTSAMNWAGKGFDDVGMKLADSLWHKGIPADLIPSSEIWNKNLRIDNEGYVCYGPQRYAAVVFYNPEFEKKSTDNFFYNASKGKTRLFRVGDWMKDFNGNDLKGDIGMPKFLANSTIASILTEIPALLKKEGILLQTPAIRNLEGFGHNSMIPPTTGLCRLLDGTLIQVAGTKNGAGDPIQSKMNIGKNEVKFDAVGVAAVRLDKNGKADALAASDLKSFESGDLKIRLDKRTDLAIWHNDKGEWEGIIQGWEGKIPSQLLSLTKKWTRISLPASYPSKDRMIVKSAVVKEVKGFQNNTMPKSEILADIDGNKYGTVKIGTQTWMTENLRTGRYNDGKPIVSAIHDNFAWYSNSGVYTWYENDSAKYNNSYGKLYNGYVLSSGNVCPAGWHVPSENDWLTLIGYFSGNGAASTGLSAANQSFKPLAGGYRWGFGNNYLSIDRFGNWWSSSGTNKRVAWNRETQSLYFIEDRGLATSYGLSLRCIKNEDN